MKTSTIQATLTGSFIFVLLKNHLDKHDYHRESVVRLTTRLMSKLKQQPKDYAKLADDAYSYVRDKHKDDKLELDVGIIIMNLGFNKPAYMQEMFGMDILTLLERATNKITLPNLTRQQGRDSYDISDELTKSIEKHTYEYLKNNKI